MAVVKKKSSSLKERLAKKREEISSRSAGLPYFVIKEGTTRMRALPVGEEREFAFEATTFYLGQQIGTVISPITFGEKCAVNEAYLELSTSKKEADRNFAKTFKPGKKYFSPHIRYIDDKGLSVDEEAGARLLILTGGTYQMLIDLYLEEEQGDFTNPLTGYDLKYKRTGKGKMDTEYNVLACKPSKLPKKYRKEYDPEAMVKELLPTYKRTKELVEQFLSLPPEDEPEEEKRPLKKKKKSDI